MVENVNGPDFSSFSINGQIIWMSYACVMDYVSLLNHILGLINYKMKRQETYIIYSLIIEFFGVNIQ